MHREPGQAAARWNQRSLSFNKSAEAIAGMIVWAGGRGELLLIPLSVDWVQSLCSGQRRVTRSKRRAETYSTAPLCACEKRRRVSSTARYHFPSQLPGGTSVNSRASVATNSQLYSRYLPPYKTPETTTGSGRLQQPVCECEPHIRSSDP